MSLDRCDSFQGAPLCRISLGLHDDMIVHCFQIKVELPVCTFVQCKFACVHFIHLSRIYIDEYRVYRYLDQPGFFRKGPVIKEVRQHFETGRERLVSSGADFPNDTQSV